jgi:GAF domain-containing protein
MAEAFRFSKNADRKTVYEEILPQIRALVEGEPDLIANLANIAAVLKEAFGFFWVGFYLNKDGQLVLGPFQGPLACTRIGYGEGVCGHAFSTRQTTIVPNVDDFAGHIVCSSASRSEIVVPIFGPDRTVFGVLDIDSDKLADLGDTDAAGLGAIVTVIEGLI